MLYFQVVSAENEFGGKVPQVNGAPGSLPPGGRMHVRDDQPPGSLALVLCQREPESVPDDWTELDRESAKAVYHAMYLRLPTAAEVP